LYQNSRLKLLLRSQDFPSSWKPYLSLTSFKLVLEAICIAVKTSKSALSYGFHDIFGLSPMVYLKTVRLNGVRRALKIADPTTATVLGIGNRYGFWHMGHFSHDYRQMFGESPSDTLRDMRQHE
jgi:AraC family ethanolamine operon transcriptional activator